MPGATFATRRSGVRVPSSIAGLIREKRRLQLCRYFYDDAVKRGEKPDPVEVIRAASLGMIGPASKAPALPSPPKSDNTSLAA
jgi:hypothetical protein